MKTIERYGTEVGIQAAAGDIVATPTGLASTVLDFTTLDLQVGQWIWIGGGTRDDPGRFGFVLGGYRGFACVKAIVPHALTLSAMGDWAVDPGIGQTIELYFGTYTDMVGGDDYESLAKVLP